jgi:hypothetical protein
MAYTNAQMAHTFRTLLNEIEKRRAALLTLSTIDENAENLRLEIKANKIAADILLEFENWFAAETGNFERAAKVDCEVQGGNSPYYG